MPRYFPIAIEPTVKASLSDLVAFEWHVKSVRATFVIPGNRDEAMEVSFAGQCIVRLVDEMPLSTEDDDSPNQGLIADHFAYWVEDALFFRTQSEVFKQIGKPCAHFRFITGWTCMDVVTGAKPCYKAMPLNARA